MKKCEMFCYQCQETARGTGCTKVGVCGKRPELSSMLDLLIYVTKGLSCVTTKLREEGKEIGKDVNHLVTVNLFTTITNANFDRDAIVARIKTYLQFILTPCKPQTCRAFLCMHRRGFLRCIFLS